MSYFLEKSCNALSELFTAAKCEFCVSGRRIIAALWFLIIILSGYLYADIGAGSKFVIDRLGDY